MAYKYAQTGPPFNFLGNLSETQRDAFAGWVNDQTDSLTDTQTFHQIRAQQLRKTAGLLEMFHSKAEVPLAPSFIKETWKPDAPGHFAYANRNDHLPAMTVLKIKEYFRSSLCHQDDAVYSMNHLRSMIEKHEDIAQYSNDAVSHVPALLTQLDTYFGKDEYSASLVHDQSDQFQGEPRYRVNPLDSPSIWEISTRSGNSPTS